MIPKIEIKTGCFEFFSIFSHLDFLIQNFVFLMNSNFKNKKENLINGSKESIHFPKKSRENKTNFFWNNKNIKEPNLILRNGGLNTHLNLNSVLDKEEAKIIKKGPQRRVDPNGKYTWADIVSGKSKKLIPSMNGKKVFLGGLKFDDIVEKGKPAIEQLPFYRQAFIKAEKEANKRQIKKAIKKAKKKALKEASVTAEGKILVASNMEIKNEAENEKRKKFKRIGKPINDDELIKKIKVMSELQIQNLINQRKNIFNQILMFFGSLDSFQPSWDKGFLFAVYHNANDAKNAIKSLSKSDFKSSLLRKIKENNPKIDKDAFTEKFYLRWTKVYQKKLSKQLKIIN